MKILRELINKVHQIKTKNLLFFLVCLGVCILIVSVYIGAPFDDKSNIEISQSYFDSGDIDNTSDYMEGAGDRALTLRAFGGFETGGFEEMLFASDEAQVLTSPAPPTDTEKYVVHLPKHSVTDSWNYMITDGFTDSNDMIFGFYIRFKFTQDDPANPSIIFTARHGYGNEHFYLIQGNDILSLWDADNNLVASIEGFIEDDVWYLFEIRFTKGDGDGSIDIYVDGVSKFSETNQNFDGKGAVEKTYMRFKGVTGSDAFPAPGYRFTIFYISSWYYYNGGSSVNDFLGDYEVIGPYQDRRASANADFGDALDNGDWADSGETPGDDASYSEYVPPILEVREGGVTTDDSDGGATPGPYGDARIDGNDNIKGGSWIMRTKGVLFLSNMQQKYGKTAHDDTTTDNTASVSVSATGSWKNSQVFSESSTYVPTTDDYFQYGLKVSGNYGRIADAWCFILHVPPIPTPPIPTYTTVHIEGGHIKGATIK